MLTIEQITSAHLALRGAKIRHGDTTEVELAVGTLPSLTSEGSRLAFCSAWIRAKKVRTQGSWWDHHFPIGGSIVFANADDVEARLRRQRGIAYMRGTVMTNGHVEFRIDPNSVHVVVVTPQEERLLQNVHGKALSQRVLEMH